MEPVRNPPPPSLSSPTSPPQPSISPPGSSLAINQKALTSVSTPRTIPYVHMQEATTKLGEIQALATKYTTWADTGKGLGRLWQVGWYILQFCSKPTIERLCEKWEAQEIRQAEKTLDLSANSLTMKTFKQEVEVFKEWKESKVWKDFSTFMDCSNEFFDLLDKMNGQFENANNRQAIAKMVADLFVKNPQLLKFSEQIDHLSSNAQRVSLEVLCNNYRMANITERNTAANALFEGIIARRQDRQNLSDSFGLVDIEEAWKNDKNIATLQAFNTKNGIAEKLQAMGIDSEEGVSRFKQCMANIMEGLSKGNRPLWPGSRVKVEPNSIFSILWGSNF